MTCASACREGLRRDRSTFIQAHKLGCKQKLMGAVRSGMDHPAATVRACALVSNAARCGLEKNKANKKIIHVDPFR